MNFKLRPWHISDLDDLVKNANNPKIARNLTDAFPHPYTEESGRGFIEMATKEDPPHVLCIEVNGEAAGGIGIHQQTGIHRFNAEIGYWLAEKYWGYGIMTRAIKEMIPYGFKHWDINRIYARIFEYNPASMRVIEKCGFTLDYRLSKTMVKDGVFIDDIMYSIRKERLSVPSH